MGLNSQSREGPVFSPIAPFSFEKEKGAKWFYPPKENHYSFLLFRGVETSRGDAPPLGFETGALPDYATSAR